MNISCSVAPLLMAIMLSFQLVIAANMPLFNVTFKCRVYSF
ncbi:hypothetical protein MNBD_ALPHA11-1357 [hydrothermal vent metagenome]|uniref:Uncharacterized protein n=1 Tax=hydrothermal vent metagenome TaxID=652676 RepID=A0A3B0TN68_9ZZZZ